ncbi:MAG: CvpA family protein [candidate division WOR-3 bacterium]
MRYNLRQMIIDLAIVVIVIISIVNGVKQGLVKSSAIILGLILGVYLAAKKYLVIWQLFFKQAPKPPYQIIWFMIVFLVTYVIVYLIGLILKKIVSLVLLSWLDKLLGLVFGAIKGLIVVWLVILLIISIFPNVTPVINRSYLAPRIMELGAKITKLKPPNIQTLPQKKQNPKKVLTNNINQYIISKSGDMSAKIKERSRICGT